jgi:hypothetical protein
VTKWPPPDEIIPAEEYDAAMSRARGCGVAVMIACGYVALLLAYIGLVRACS